MISVQFGLYPLTGIVVAMLLFAVYHGILRMKCHPSMVQRCIILFVIITTIFTFARPSRTMIAPPVDATPAPSALQPSADAGDVITREIPSSPSPDNMGVLEETRPHTDTSHGKWHLAQIAGWCYGAGILLILLHQLTQLAWCLRLRRKSQLVKSERQYQLFTTDHPMAFSFGKSIFIPSAMDDETKDIVLSHELCHLRHHHFWNLLLTQWLLAANWFNPLVWLLFNELKLQQELEVDLDVLSKDVDREAYQMSLLRMCSPQHHWLSMESAFGTKDIKKRISFMNTNRNIRHTGGRMLYAFMATLAIATGTSVFACQTTIVAQRHPLQGCWAMDFTRPAGSDSEYYPPFRQYAFYNHDTFFTPHLSYREGLRFEFGFSGEEVVMRNDTLVNAHGEPLVYRIINENTFQSDWKRKKTDRSLITTEVVTDQWSRATVAPEILSAFAAAYQSDTQHHRPLDGIWQVMDKDNRESYLLINDTLAMRINYFPDPDSTIFRYSGSGSSGTIQYGENPVLHFRTDHRVKTLEGTTDDIEAITIETQEGDKVHSYSIRRLPSMPSHIKRMLATVWEENQLGVGD